MYTTQEKRFYTPQFSPTASISVRRLAWAMGKSMPKTVDLIVRLLPSMVSKEKVCAACRDAEKCASCVFASVPEPEPHEVAALEAVI
jgi:hypothetical protein